MKDNFINYGLFSDEPDLLRVSPGLARLKARDPEYVARAEKAQMTARRFAREEMLPRALAIDAACAKDPTYFDWDLWRSANRAKLTICGIPEGMGGLGWGALDSAIMAEEMASVCMGSTANIAFNTFGLLCATVEFRPDIVLRLIREMVAAQREGRPLFWSWAITEPSAGTDAEDPEAMRTMRPSTQARKVPGGYRISGTKCFITNGSLAHFVIAAIPTDPEHPKETMATFLVPTSSDGFKVGRVERKCGQKASQTAELFFNDVFVPDENLWEPPGRGLRHTREILSITRGFVGISAAGMARGALERCIDFARRKKVGSHRLIDEGWVRMAIADMLKDLLIVRQAGYDFAIAVDTLHVYRMFQWLPFKTALRLPENLLLNESLDGLLRRKPVMDFVRSNKHRLVNDGRIEDFVQQASAVKVAGTDLAMKTASRVLDIVGLEGMAGKHGIEKYFRDAKVTQIYEGTNQANRIDIFNHEFEKLLDG